MSEHPESHKRQCNFFGEEDPADRRWKGSKGISHTSYDKILESRCMLQEGWSFMLRRVACLNKSVWQLEHYIANETEEKAYSKLEHSQKNGRDWKPQEASSINSTLYNSWGTRNTTKTIQSRYEI
jgi:hypothetical protein